MKVYLSGEISGLDIRVAREKFAKAEKFWKGLGVEVVNPLKNGLSIEDDWIKHISRDLELLNECKYVYMMEGWQRSVGACVEYDFSVRTGKKIYFESNMKRNGEKIARIEAAIHEVTGLRLEQYCTKSRKRDGHFARLLFAHFCSLEKIEYSDIAESIHRYNYSPFKLQNLFNNEIRHNPTFRVMAERVEGILQAVRVEPQVDLGAERNK